ncbi:amidohydrolase family protein [Microbacterium sp. LTA6]|uniref:amidohydrolase family protein n=1 Tax=unclassified Microbacterium TaxID=2609290 RepID=UPI0031393B17
MTSEVYAADWVVPVVAAPIRDGAVVVEDGRIAWIGPQADLPRRWTDAPRQRGVIVPGLVNAHTHLQYTGFREIGAGSYTSFEEWSFVFGELYDAVEPASWHEAAREGARLAIASGTTVFAEIVTDTPARGALPECGVGGIEYLEAIGQFDRIWREGGRADFLAWLEEPTDARRGISPHAAYSLDGSVVTDLVRIAADRGLRVHSHLGESFAEADFYRHGDRTVLGAYGDLRDEFELVRKGGVGHTTGEYADAIGLLSETTHVAHAIYLDRAERDLLLARGTQVALCPRSNRVIGLAEAPVAAYLAEGHEISVGTDSLASSPSLDLMEDVRELAAIARKQGYTDSDLAERLVRAATLGGAKAMGLADDGYGGLSVGGPADLALFDIAVEGTEVHEALVADGAGSCVLTVAGGREVFRASA